MAPAAMALERPGSEAPSFDRFVSFAFAATSIAGLCSIPMTLPKRSAKNSVHVPDPQPKSSKRACGPPTSSQSRIARRSFWKR